MEQDVLRKCIVTGEIKDKENLLRFVVLDGHLVPDFQKKLGGKGIYVTNSKKILEEAVAKKMFTRVSKKNLQQDESSIVELVDKLMKKRGLNFVNLGRKAGAVVSGFEKVSEKIKKQKADFIIEAKDAGNDGHSKIEALAKGLTVFDNLYSVDELDAALNKTNTVYVAFLKSQISQSAFSEFNKIKTYFEIIS